MKNIIKLKAMLRIAGIVALAAAIGFSMTVTLASCEDGVGGPGPDYNPGGTNNPGGSNPGTNPGGNTPGNTPGAASTLTVTGLPSGSWNAEIYSPDVDIYDLWAIVDAHDTPKEVATGPWTTSNVFRLLRFNPSTSGPWTGSGSWGVVLYRDGDYVNYVGRVNFSNGSATVPWSSFTLLDWNDFTVP